MAEAISLCTNQIYTRAMYKKGLSASVFVVEPDVGGEK